MRTLLFILSIIIISCSSTKSNSTENNITIAFGNGGGFAGIETKYELKQDGSIYKIQMRDSSVAIVKKIDAKEVKGIFDAAEALKDYKYFKPDNIYQFIEFLWT